MRILVLADQESKSLYDYYSPEKLDGVDLIIACGDLKKSYLAFFGTMSRVPVLFVQGNHDHWYRPGRDNETGCICIEDDIYVYKGVRILGLGGSMEYMSGAENQYTEAKMAWRIRKLCWKLRRRGGFDILVTHAPARDFHDLDDLPHRGFACFRTLIDKYRPRLFIHGHVHANYGGGFKRVDKLGDTVVVNAYEHYIVEYP